MDKRSKFFRRTGWRIFLRVAALFATLLTGAFFVVMGPVFYIYLLLLVPVVLVQLVDFYNFQKKAHDELSQFVEAVHYRDFSRYFDVKHAPVDLQPLRQGFNEINSTFKVISKEKETQYQYVQKILELVNTGILSYQEESGEVVWLNESLKQLLNLPYLKTIHSLRKRDEKLYNSILLLQPGESRVATASQDNSSFKILMSATAFQTEGKKFKLIAFQNVNEALDETESKAWQKLLSVMTHEIMNSIAPISSLAETLKSRLKQAVPNLDNSNGSVDDLELGIDTIKRRSEGLLKFAETYRNLNKITTLNLQKVYVRDLFENLYHLMQPTLEQKHIDMDVILKDTDLMVEADTNLLEQVLINLLVNGIEATREKADPRLLLSAYRAAGQRLVITVSDNGSGMSEEVMDKIFIPFFSTKKHGSGIGLSLCKQIMMLHRGNIRVQSTEGQGATFLLQF